MAFLTPDAIHCLYPLPPDDQTHYDKTFPFITLLLNPNSFYIYSLKAELLPKSNDMLLWYKIIDRNKMMLWIVSLKLLNFEKTWPASKVFCYCFML